MASRTPGLDIFDTHDSLGAINIRPKQRESSPCVYQSRVRLHRHSHANRI